ASPAVDAQALPVRPAPDVACLQTSACCHLDRSPGGVGVEVDEGGRMARAVGTEELQAGPAGEVLAAHPPSELHVGAAAVRAGDDEAGMVGVGDRHHGSGPFAASLSDEEVAV